MPVEPFDAAHHDRGRFTCGVEAIDRYLRAVARPAAAKYAAQTYVLAPAFPRAQPCEIIGYYTLVPHAYRDAEMDETVARALGVEGLRLIPTILLAQLGVAAAHQGKGVGAALLRNVLRRALYVALSAGAVAVITDPADANATNFYVRHGFKALPKQEPRLIVPTAMLARHNPDVVEAFRMRPHAARVSFSPQRLRLRAAMLSTEMPRARNLGQAVHERFGALGGVDLPDVPREAIRQPAKFSG